MTMLAPCMIAIPRFARNDKQPMKALYLALIILCSCSPRNKPTVAPAPDDLPATGTFSIIAYDSATGQLGGAVQSRVFSVGNGVLWAEAGVGIAATQAIVDVGYGPRALALLRAGLTPETIVKAILDSDPDPGYAGQPWPKAGRQFAVMNAKGEYAA